MANVVIEMSGDEAKLWRSLQKVEKKNKDVETSFKKVGKSARTAGKQAQIAGREARQGFGSSAVASLKSYAVGMIGISSAVTLLISGLRSLREEMNKAVDSREGLTGANRQLLQIAQGDTAAAKAADFQAMQRQADRISLQRGIARTETRDLIFSSRSEKFKKAVPQIARAVGANVLEMSAATVIAGAIPALFDRKINATQAMNAVLAGAETSKLSVGQFMQGLPQAAEGGAQMGASASQMIGALSFLSEKFATPQTTGQRLKAITGKMARDEQFAGLDLLPAVAKLQGMSKEKRKEFLGDNAEVNAIYSRLDDDFASIKKRADLIKTEIGKTGTTGSQLNLRSAAGEMAQASMIGLNRKKIMREFLREARLADEGATMQGALLDISSAQDVKLLGKTGAGRVLGEMGKFATGRAAQVASTSGSPGFTNMVGGLVSDQFDVKGPGDAFKKWTPVGRVLDMFFGGTAERVLENQDKASAKLEQAADNLLRASTRTTGNTAAARQRAAMNPVATE